MLFQVVDGRLTLFNKRRKRGPIEFVLYMVAAHAARRDAATIVGAQRAPATNPVVPRRMQPNGKRYTDQREACMRPCTHIGSVCN